ncbi:hypothetical protein MPTK1_7g08280 [Marchantia polymorpha subsp. ruderalis]|uniref:Uncharacterized protein n=2 Tax=Marchantia polymorpha TaxID=3197 RepID=A0AAF6BXC7_MARPO|nr:hypothetical protein MARPO_0146s0028 [Marchantia polymorpha]BBN16659.1 hypothetical protein Mp_7g08280 [Marchantia polymorpha subsp. ruderalis]PTQ29207.1 hypothetical protein MARPO_0146s0028 [Marchantia polymorpha]PTQ29208.1 hypothetical protein MARPO_0146s0028 [Marchantia polymorpha]BBN16660.1 hypothetical protein Mp_7g08280 [Marchantia polymorpha subsp. ruderalis]|eukprot:PTQ29206.1 hypothetical protein MARPO_0146s0028 [Marchantia polymorpha]
MALQLHTCADLRPDALHTFCIYVRERRTRNCTTRRRALADEGSSASRAATGAAGAQIRASLSQRAGDGPPSSSARPQRRSSSSSRRRGAKPDAGDRSAQVEEWVSRKVNDPLVEIDPVTVDKKIQAEERLAREARAAQRAAERAQSEAAESSSLVPPEGITATVAPSSFDRPPPGFPGGLNASPRAVAAAALALLAAGAAYLLLRSNAKAPGSLSPSPVPAPVPGNRDVGTSRVIHHSSGAGKESSPPQELHEQFLHAGSDQAVSVRASVVLTSVQTQTITTVTPAPVFVGHQAQSAIPSSSPAVGMSFAVSPPSDREARPFEEAVGLDGPSGQVAADLEVDAVEFQKALVFDSPPAGKELLPEYLRASSGAEPLPSPAAARVAPAGFSSSGPEFADDLAEISGVQLPGADFRNAMVSDAFSMEKCLVDDGFVFESSSPQLVEDPVLFNLDNDAPALPVPEDVHIAGVQNGAASAESEFQPEEDRRKSYAEALQAVVPAIAVGAGAFSTFSGLDSGLEMVGLVATASFVAREIFLASSRQQLCGDVRKVKDHKSFLDFLKTREIIRDLPQE